MRVEAVALLVGGVLLPKLTLNTSTDSTAARGYPHIYEHYAQPITATYVNKHVRCWCVSKPLVHTHTHALINAYYYLHCMLDKHWSPHSLWPFAKFRSHNIDITICARERHN